MERNATRNARSDRDREVYIRHRFDVLLGDRRADCRPLLAGQLLGARTGLTGGCASL